MNEMVSFYGRLLVRRAPVMLVLLLLCITAAVMVAQRMKATYVSQARMLLQEQEISESLAASTVQIAALEELRLLREQVTRRAVLIDIAHEYDVFENIRSLAPDDVVEGMRGALEINISGGTSRSTGPQPALLEITFSARSGQIAADVVNEIMTFIESENVTVRSGSAGQTLAFFERQVERLGEELEINSTRIAEFQAANADALPADQPFRLQRQAVLQQLLTSSERELRALRDARARTIDIFEATGNVGNDPIAQLSPAEQELAQLRSDLRRARTTFSETSRQVQQLVIEIEQLEAEIAEQATLPTPVEETSPEDPTAPLLNLQLAEIDSRIDTLEGEISDAQAELVALEAAIDRAPRVGTNLDTLQRAYDLVQLEYDDMRRSLTQARTGVQVEQSGRGQRLVTLDPPVVPSSPSGPGRTTIAAAGAVLGLLLAAGYFVLMELLNRTVRRPAELVHALDITPLATIPYIETRIQRLTRWSMRAAAILLVLIGVPAGLWAVNQYYLPLEELTELVMSQLGLS